MGEFVPSPTCNQVLSTYDVSHVKFYQALPFSFHFSFACGESLGTRLVKIHNGIIFDFDADICPSAATLLSMLISGLQCDSEDVAMQC